MILPKTRPPAPPTPSIPVRPSLPQEPAGPGVRRCRTLWISDLHLGTKACQASRINEFLDAHTCDRLFLVGDVFDGWKLGRGWFWDEAQTGVVRRILSFVEEGTEVIYVPGNHDEALRGYENLVLAGVDVASEFVHEGADGRTYLVLHGDKFDAVVRCRWLASLGDRAYSMVNALNRWQNALRRRLGIREWSLSGYLKQSVKKALAHASRFEDALVREAKDRDVDGVICGHIHKAELLDLDGLLYINDGDWVDSCTGLVERFDGTLELVHWDGSGKDVVQASSEAVARA